MDGAGGIKPPAPSVVSYRHARWGADSLMEADSLLRWVAAGWRGSPVKTGALRPQATKPTEVG